MGLINYYKLELSDHKTGCNVSPYVVAILVNNLFYFKKLIIKKTHYKFNFHYNEKQVEDIYLQCELVQVKE